MGIHCEINLCKPENGAFLPGSIINGSIKYAIDEETVFKRITVSLKGEGHLSMKHKNKNQTFHHRNHEYYVDEKNVLHDDEEGKKALPIGCYETQFRFKLPEKVPSSLKFLRNMPRYVIRCNIRYNISIKFQRPGMLQFDKKFKREITVISGITPRLPTVPTICGEQKKLTQLFSSKKSVVNIKANIKNSVINTGGKIEFDYEVINDTNVVIKSIETQLVEIYTFKSKSNRQVSATSDVKDTDSKTGSIKAGETKNMSVVIEVPSERTSLDYSQMVTRDYVVKVNVGLPMPHRDFVLEIPVQIGDVDDEPAEGDAPPSYWEAMAEDAKSGGSDDNVSDEEKGGKS